MLLRPDPARPGTRYDNDWNDVLADDLNHLRLHMGLFDALGLRLRRSFVLTDAEAREKATRQFSIAPCGKRELDEQGGAGLVRLARASSAGRAVAKRWYIY
jgi:hypothetical protein